MNAAGNEGARRESDGQGTRLAFSRSYAELVQALKEATKRMPEWLKVEQTTLSSRPRYAKGGRPGKDATPQSIERRIKATLGIYRERAELECERRAGYIVGTSVLDSARLWQGGVERGFRFLKDPLFLASSVFVKKPERIVGAIFSALGGSSAITVREGSDFEEITEIAGLDRS